MGERGRGDGRKRAGGSAPEGEPAGPDPADRPGASGHRFGPGLVCSECGLRWDVHQRDPHPCVSVPPPDPFERRPRD
jgi:hypothetical protein